MHLLEGMSKKRHTRAPYEAHTLEGIIKKDIPMLFSTSSFLGERK